MRYEISRLKIDASALHGSPCLYWFVCSVLILFSSFPLAQAAPGMQGIVNSKHNLSASSASTTKSVSEDEICIFCHTPHGKKGQTPLWNHADSGAVYIPYASSTKKAIVGQPTGASKLCLSCHDGTVAIGMLRHNSSARTAQELGVMRMGSTRLGTDLSDDHPISFTYDHALVVANGQLKDPATLTREVRLDKNQQVQCTSCHSPHDNRYGKFLVQNNFGSALCLVCHNLNPWNSSVHKTSIKSWNNIPPNPWPHTDETTVMANGCENCHRPHSAGTRQRLLNFGDEESNCFSCHNGNVAAKNIQSEFNKLSVHPVKSANGIHDPVEDALNAPRHAECVDCHNPHAAREQPASAPVASGALAGVKGVSSGGSRMNTIANEYELCFRCHADSANRGPARVERQFVQTNTRLEFTSAGASYHPVETTGKNPNVPSLIAPWTTASLVYCTDCHNNNTGPGAGGAGPKGPHGSSFVPLLERRLELTDYQTESPAAYAMCYKCHSRNSILSDQSFKSHRKHVVESKTACTTCHDSHGVSLQTHLINFNTSYVAKSSGGRLEYINQGLYRGSCYLTCHGKDHNPLSY